jgi:hypothetical protein
VLVQVALQGDRIEFFTGPDTSRVASCGILIQAFSAALIQVTGQG